MPAARAALAGWTFSGELRHYQADVLDRVSVRTEDPLHIVAPPGSGKTLLGLLLAVERGARTLVLAPTLTVRRQWADAATALSPDPAQVSEDPDVLADLTALTYQVLSVLDTANPLAGLARTRWCEELEAEGRSVEAAAAWVADLARTNPDAYRSGIARRSRRLRRRLAREDADFLVAALHPRARDLLDRLVAHGIDTIVLDECHHLLDHWALVVAALVARLRDAGRRPLVIGLTATLPSPDDADEYDNYTSLLGDVDYEVPVPAVVREGNLAPFRDLVRFVEPTEQELAFLGSHAEGLDVLLRSTFSRDAGLAHLVDALQPADVDGEADARLAAAFGADFAGAEAAAAMLCTVAPQHPLVDLLPYAARRPPTTEEALRLLGRHAVERILPDPARSEQWERIRRALADFGYSLTDRGVRRSRDPIDTLLASSLAKDHAVCDILRIERGEIGDDRLRALVVADFERHGNRHGGLVSAAGALRTFDVVAADVAVRGLYPVLVTGSRTHIATRDEDVLLPALESALGVPVAAAPLEGGVVSRVHAPGVGAAGMVRAVSALLSDGPVRVVVGTRGLFGEGWDCPAVNTLIDLSAVATASAVQQLRGRTLRCDPAWPDKVAHNWTVTAVLPAGVPLRAAPDVDRLRRKHARLWGLDRDDRSRVVRGLAAAAPERQRTLLTDLVEHRRDVPVSALNAASDLGDRAATRAEWRVGEPYVDREAAGALLARRPGTPVFRTRRRTSRVLGGAIGGIATLVAAGIAAAATAGPLAAIVGAIVLGGAGLWALPPLVSAWRASRGDGVELYTRIAAVVGASLEAAGRTRGAVGAPSVVEDRGSPDRIDVSIGFPEATLADQRLLAEALAELFGAVRTPRYVMEVGRGGRTWIVRRLLGGAGAEEDARYLPVPALIGRRRADAEAFAALWDRRIGPSALHALDRPEALALAARARRASAGSADAGTIDSWS
ncbi:DEAD/DEAH box helicase family protein [Microbacterium aurantiacum]|uniref:DEAD/DEAH box helicase family protein n=1 Tax=Microbacterium aurantiacum TaxID=162393 RepID=UPI001F21489D|nr:DEAD/DEAH box helicase family protein [Microbacterium aurantiacum]